MGANLHVLASGIMDATGVPAASKISSNARVSCAAGPVSVMSDILVFSGPSTTGNFLSPMSRVTIGGVPAINAQCQGQAINGATGIPAPFTIAITDPRVSGT